MNTPSDLRDLPFAECVHKAVKLISPTSDVYQKFTCQYCGSRQTMDVPNKFYTRGICEECQQETNIESRGCGFLLHARIAP